MLLVAARRAHRDAGRRGAAARRRRRRASTSAARSWRSLGDLLGSVGTIIAALVILATGWTPADALDLGGHRPADVAPRLRAAAQRGRRAARIDAAPPRHAARSRRRCGPSPGVESVHDLHMWTITSGFDAMSGHVRSNGRPSEEVLHDLQHDAARPIRHRAHHAAGRSCRSRRRRRVLHRRPALLRAGRYTSPSARQNGTLAHSARSVTTP